jgi:hypothetical protein
VILTATLAAAIVAASCAPKLPDALWVDMSRLDLELERAVALAPGGPAHDGIEILQVWKQWRHLGVDAHGAAIAEETALIEVSLYRSWFARLLRLDLTSVPVPDATYVTTQQHRDATDENGVTTRWREFVRDETARDLR